jgi:hypothetical protein
LRNFSQCIQPYALQGSWSDTWSSRYVLAKYQLKFCPRNGICRVSLGLSSSMNQKVAKSTTFRLVLGSNLGQFTTYANFSHNHQENVWTAPRNRPDHFVYLGLQYTFIHFHPLLRCHITSKVEIRNCSKIQPFTKSNVGVVLRYRLRLLPSHRCQLTVHNPTATWCRTE